MSKRVLKTFHHEDMWYNQHECIHTLMSMHSYWLHLIFVVDGFQDAIIQQLEFCIFCSSIQILETPKDILMRSKYFTWILISYSTFMFFSWNFYTIRDIFHCFKILLLGVFAQGVYHFLLEKEWGHLWWGGEVT